MEEPSGGRGGSPAPGFPQERVLAASTPVSADRPPPPPDFSGNVSSIAGRSGPGSSGSGGGGSVYSAWTRRPPAPPHNPGQAVLSTPSLLQSESTQAGLPPVCLNTRSPAQFSSPAFPGLRPPSCSSTQSQYSTPAFPR